MLQHGADANCLDHTGQTALHRAAAWNQKTVVERLLQFTPTDTNDQKGKTALHLTAASGSIDVVQTLLDHNALLEARDKRLRTPLHAAAEAFDMWIERDTMSCIKLLLPRGADINAVDGDTDTAYSLAAKNCHSREVLFLLRPHGKSNAEIERDIDLCIIQLNDILKAEGTGGKGYRYRRKIANLREI